MKRIQILLVLLTLFTTCFAKDGYVLRLNYKANLEASEHITLPVFSDEEKGIYKYFGTTARYPCNAIRRGLTGYVIVMAVLDKEGQITDIRLLEHKPGLKMLEKAALKVVRKMPKWKTPAMKDGEPIACEYGFIFNFMCQDLDKVRKKKTD